MSLLALAGGFLPAEADASVSYIYDPLGRVVVARYDNGVCVAYVYDANGNRTAQVSGGTSGPSAAVWGTGIYGCFVWSP
jgi:YD repeat-containing protein